MTFQGFQRAPGSPSFVHFNRVLYVGVAVKITDLPNVLYNYTDFFLQFFFLIKSLYCQ